MTRWFALVAFAIAAAACFLLWSWLGRLQPVPDVPGARVACLSYSPYRPGQTPFDPGFTVPRQQIEEDLRLLATRTGCVRTYAVDQGQDAVVPIAEALGLEVLLGAWLGRDPDQNAEQIDGAIALADAHPDTVRAIVVGNEVLLRGELGPEELAALLRDAGTRTATPITYADVWEFWIRNADALAGAVDFVTIHILPYWEDEPVGADRAVAHVEAVLARVRQAIPGKRLMIGETGWPSAGRMRDGARPSRVNAARFVRGVVAMAEAQGLDYNLIEAFDQPWKRVLEGTVGGYWGLFDAARQPKFPLAGPVSELPHWPLYWVSGSLLGALPLLWAALRRPLSAHRWLVLAAAGQAAGVVMMLQADAAILASRTPFGWLAAATGLSISGATAWLLIEALAAGDIAAARAAPLRAVVHWLRKPLPGGARREIVLGAFQLAAAGAALATSLGLVFDPRYRDFPVAAFLVPAIGFALAAVAGRGAGRAPPGPAETRLGALLALAAIAIAAREGPANVQALAWAVTCMLLALPWGVRAWDWRVGRT